MYKTDCVYWLTLSNGRKVSLILSGKKHMFAITKPGGSTKIYEDLPVDVAYQRLIEAWSMAGIYVTKITNFRFGEKRFWYSHKYDLSVMLETIFQRDRDDLSDGIDECFEHAWYLKLSKPVGELDEDLVEWLVAGLYEHGFQYETPPSAYTPTGQMFNRITINTQGSGKRVIVTNRWQRDV